MAKITKDAQTGIATFELETREAFQQFQKGLEYGEHQWGANPETNELLKFRSENNQESHIYVKYQDFHKRVR